MTRVPCSPLGLPCLPGQHAALDPGPPSLSHARGSSVLAEAGAVRTDRPGHQTAAVDDQLPALGALPWGG